ncbi:DNA-binding response regulator [Bacillus sp. SRB_336]|nr:DNA-binding response regulator [Bacillus sp. SRB_336]
MIRVLLADDQVLVREGFRAIIERDGGMQVVGEAGDGVDAVVLCRQARPDVVLMDTMMPLLDGLSATRQVLALSEPPKVLVLTTFDRNDWVYDALKAGASGFLLKDVRSGQLTAAIRTVFAGDALLAPTITRRLIEEFVARSPGVPSVEPSGLTTREVEALRLLARGLTNTEIADELVVEVSTVKTHVNRVLTKLGLRNRTQAVVYAYETGLIHAAGR